MILIYDGHFIDDPLVIVFCEPDFDSLGNFLFLKPMTNDDFKLMSLSVANASLSLADKYKWVSLHNTTANLYYMWNGIIKPVPPEGWWY